jgi:hypothetical protein
LGTALGARIEEDGVEVLLGTGSGLREAVLLFVVEENLVLLHIIILFR